MIEKSRNNVLPRRADIQGAQHGLRIGLIGFFLADIVFAGVFSVEFSKYSFLETLVLFIHIGGGHIYLIALSIMLSAGFFSGKVLERRWQSLHHPIVSMSLITALTTLALASVLAGITVFCIKSFGSPHSLKDEFANLFGPMALVLIFGLVPAGLTGLLYGVYIRRRYRMIGH